MSKVDKFSGSNVLILVVMEEGQRLTPSDLESEDGVLILVVMEEGQRLNNIIVSFLNY